MKYKILTSSRFKYSNHSQLYAKAFKCSESKTLKLNKFKCVNLFNWITCDAPHGVEIGVHSKFNLLRLCETSDSNIDAIQSSDNFGQWINCNFSNFGQNLIAVETKCSASTRPEKKKVWNCGWRRRNNIFFRYFNIF